MINVKDKVVLITGAGRGIGREHALEFGRRGAKVVVNDLGSNVRGDGSSNLASSVAAEIVQLGGAAVANNLSVADPNEAKAMVQQAIDEFGRVDIVINNAGILRNKTFKNTTTDDFRLIVETHLLGSAYVTHAAWPFMYEQNFGRIILTSSVSGIFGQFGQSAYGAAKMGMLGLMNVLALEGRSHGIKVNCLSPGADTRMTALDKELDIDPDKPRPQSHPKLVTPVALYLASEYAPTGMVIHGLSGKYLSTETFANKGISLNSDAVAEDLISNIGEVLDMSSAKALGELGNISLLGS